MSATEPQTPAAAPPDRLSPLELAELRATVAEEQAAQNAVAAHEARLQLARLEFQGATQRRQAQAQVLRERYALQEQDQILQTGEIRRTETSKGTP